MKKTVLICLLLMLPILKADEYPYELYLGGNHELLYRFTESSWELTWTYYVVNKYVVGNVQYAPNQFSSSWINEQNQTTSIQEVGCDQYYGVWRGTWQWWCFHIPCWETGTTACVDTVCGGPTKAFPEQQTVLFNFSYNYIGSLINHDSPSLEKPQVVSNNGYEYSLPESVRHVFSPGGYLLYPDKPHGNGDGPVPVDHSH